MSGIIGLSDEQGASARHRHDEIAVLHGNFTAVSEVQHKWTKRLRVVNGSELLDGHDRKIGWPVIRLKEAFYPVDLPDSNCNVAQRFATIRPPRQKIPLYGMVNCFSVIRIVFMQSPGGEAQRDNG